MAPGILRQDDEEVYDYIICGGGTSGPVLAGRLAEDGNNKVLVVEAGADNADLENTQMAGGWSQLFDSETDWNLIGEPNEAINGRQVKHSRGRYLGGSSGCNGTLCIRGTEQDYDDWGMDGWSGKDMFRCMAKATTFHEKEWFPAEKKAHGYDGPLHIEPHDLAPISDLVMKSYESSGMGYDADMFTHGRNPHGCGHAPRTVHQGLRSTGADFITKTYRRDNVKIKCNTVVDKVLFEDSSASGKSWATRVALIPKEGEPYTVRARKEIILSGGSYCTPTMLLRSGVGPKAELEQLNIPVVVDSPGVGKNLQDHLIAFIFYEVNEPNLTTDHLLYHGKAFETTYLLWKNEKKGFLGTFPFGSFAFARLDDRLADEPLWKDAHREPGRDPMGLTRAQPNIEFFSTECYGGPKQYAQPPADGSSAFAIIPELFSPRSRGEVTLKSADPHDLPRVDHRYLTDELDMLLLSEACKFGNEVVMQGRGTKDIVKGSWPRDLKHHEYKTREDWVPYVRENATTCYHPAGTSKMGPASDPMAVVDGELRVHGVEGLRVCDVSIMPKLNQGHTQMPAYAIGERLAEMMRA